MLKLRKATVVEAGPAMEPEQRLGVALEDGQRRAAIVDVGLHGACAVGDEVILNVQALDLGLSSGGFDVVHVNLTHGLAGGEDSTRPRKPAGPDGSTRPDSHSPPGDPLPAHVMKLPYTSLQHAVDPVDAEATLDLPLERPVAVLGLHGQLAAVAWAFAEALPASRLGFVQTAGGALPGGHSRTVTMLQERGLLHGHLTAGPAFGGGEGEAITTAGAIHHGLRALDWDAVVCGPGPGIVGSGSPLGHGGLSALDSAHAALALGAPTLVVARMSSADPRPRHRGLSHHTLTVLDLLLEPATVALPAGIRSPVGAELRAGLSAAFGSASRGGPQLELDVERPARMARHDWRRAPVDLPAYGASGLPSVTMGRGILEDPLFFAAALAAGAVLAELCEQVAPGA